MSRNSPSISWPVFLVVISTTLSVLAAEGVLRAFRFEQDFLGLSIVADPRYGHRIGSVGVTDEWGFRNPRVPLRPYLVAIGDSQTYGVGANAGGAWPAQLGDRLQRVTYNLGVGGYGPVQYDFLWDDFVSRLDPAVVVVGLYLGNDIRDAFNYSSLLENSNSLRPDIPPRLPEIARTASNRPFDGLRQFLYEHSVLYNMAKIAFPRLVDIATRQLASDGGESASAREMKNGYQVTERLGALRLDSPENDVGLRITFAYIERLAQKCQISQRRCVLLIIPTKESVLESRIRSAGLAEPAFDALWAAEKQIRTALLETAQRHGLHTVDALPALSSAAAAAELYPAFDGHPNRVGYGVITSEVARAIGRGSQ